jgi:predicted dehydrogenase
MPERKRSYLSGLGVMGRRHLIGLVASGHVVDAFDPSEAACSGALADLEQRDLDHDLVRFVAAPCGKYAAAVFSEHADFRFGNVDSFLASAGAERFLLEKPLSSDPTEVERFAELFGARGIDTRRVFGNFTRRTWPSSARLQSLVDAAPFITMTVHGGAFGLGNNGIHHLDYFLFLTRCNHADVRYARLFETMIASGRGGRFRDFGGQFIVENERGLMSSLCMPDSSVAPVMVVAGPHFSATIDERTLDWTLAVRKIGSTAPVYRCGFEYEVLACGPMDFIAMETATGLWAEGAIELPNLNEALAAHRLLHAILDVGDAPRPYRYT